MTPQYARNNNGRGIVLCDIEAINRLEEQKKIALLMDNLQKRIDTLEQRVLQLETKENN